ncbi:hypothetical protein SGFS_043280 [Streptomyces graminofaciens]|uniref:N-acetyltransferase domain-containing protein n=1 Tax=Streptomyces graminofaciens TaxID=68212 RepID=A0ABM7FB29_9ACTN|nr:GNAT family N-acetyltransferase [Streptomyces graminofaciens]BBC33034.1 hypothetical protein SGFS_043280 [Streptomyces graminofaciens]
MTDTETLLAAYDAQMRGAPPNPPAGVTYEQDGPVVRVVGQVCGYVAAASDLGVRGAELDELIVRQRDYFGVRGESLKWKVRGYDRPTELTGRLLAAGFVAEEPETVVVGIVEDLTVRQSVLPDGVTVRQVTAETDMRRIAALESAVWEQDLHWLADDLIGRIAAAPDGIAVFVAEADGEVVSAAWIIFREASEFASLYGGSTLTAWRGRGIYRALVAARAELAAAREVPYLHVDASADSHPVLRGLGFRAVTTTTPYVWSPPGPQDLSSDDRP